MEVYADFLASRQGRSFLEQIVRRLSRAIPLGGATKPPGGLPDVYYTLEAMAVDPLHQGKGVGRLLLETAEELSFASDSETAGIYFFTGDEKNYHIYLRFGYQLLEKKQAALFTSYHMFLGAPQF